MKTLQTFYNLLGTSSVGALLVTLGLGSSFFSCSDDVAKPTEVNADSIIAEVTPLPTTDQLEEKFEKTAMVFGDNRTAFSRSLANRLTNTTNEIGSGVKAFVFDKGYVSHFTVDEVTAMFKAYRMNATFVLIDPANTDRSALVDTLQKAIEVASAKGQDVTLPNEMLARFSQFATAGSADDSSHAEAVAVNRNGTYVVPNLKDAYKEHGKNGVIQQVTEDGDTVRLGLAAEEYEPNGYDYGKSADMLVQWMTRCAEAGTGSFSAGVTSGNEQVSAQMVTYQQTLGPTVALERKMLYELNFEIYSFYKGDTNEDYYLVHCTPTFHASQLGCTRQTSTDPSKSDCIWTETDKAAVLSDGTVLNPKSSSSYTYRCWFGPYLKGSVINFKIEGTGDANETITPLDPLPRGDMSGNAALTSGLKHTFTSVSMLDNSYWGGSDGKTVNLSQSFSHKDQGMICAPNGGSSNWLEWVFAGAAPTRSYTPPVIGPSMGHRHTRSQKECSVISYFHTLVNSFQYSDFSEDITFTFVVKNPKQHQGYKLHFNDVVYVGELYAENYNNANVEALTTISFDESIPLYEPARKDNFVIECSDPEFLSHWEQQIKDRLQESFTTQWSGAYPSFSVYGTTAEVSKQKAKNIFADFSQVIYVVANRYNIADTYTFTLHAEGSTENILSFQLRDLKIK